MDPTAYSSSLQPVRFAQPGDIVFKRRLPQSDVFEDVVLRPSENGFLAFDANGQPATLTQAEMIEALDVAKSDLSNTSAQGALREVVSAPGTSLRDWRRKLAGMLNGTQTLTSVAVFGDSWSSLTGHWLRYATPQLKAALGDAGPGYISFGGEYSATVPADETASVSSTGTWTAATVSSGAHSLDCTQVSSTSNGARQTITLSSGVKADSVVLHYLKQSGGGTFRYRFNSGSWTTIDSSNATSTSATAALSGVPTTAAWVLDVEVLSASSSGVALFGAELKSSTTGIRVNKCAYPGRTSGQYAAVNATSWRAGITALSPDLAIIMLGTNDQAAPVSAETFTANIQAMIDNLRATKAGMDVLLVAPAENLAARATSISVYRDALLALAVTNKCGFVDIYEAFGTSVSEYNDSAPRILFSTGDTLHPTVLGRIQISETILRYLTESIALGVGVKAMPQIFPEATGITASQGRLNVFTNSSTAASYWNLPQITTAITEGAPFYIANPTNFTLDLRCNAADTFQGGSGLTSLLLQPRSAAMFTPALTAAGAGYWQVYYPRASLTERMLIAFGSTGTSGGGSATNQYTSANIASSTTANGAAYAYNQEHFLGGALSGNTVRSMRWNRPFVVEFMFALKSSTTNGIVLIGLGQTSSSTSDPSGRYIGIKCIGTALYGLVHDGTTLTSVNLSITMTNSARRITISSDGAGNVAWTVGNFDAIGSTALGPSTNNSAEIRWQAAVTNGGDSSQHELQVTAPVFTF